MRTIEEIGPAKLLPAEVELIREAADVLLFSETGAGDVLDEVEELLHRLVESERWSEERAGQLGGDLAAGGPVALA
jgi:hypothetical protein